MKCGLCGAEVKEQPKITADGKCSVCGAKLSVAKQAYSDKHFQDSKKYLKTKFCNNLNRIHFGFKTKYEICVSLFYLLSESICTNAKQRGDK